MPSIVPGANWQPVDWTGRAARVKGRGAVGHVAVSGAANLPPSGPAIKRSADWHFYLPKDPTPTGQRFYQYLDLDLQCWASAAGNTTLPAWESQGGLGTAAEVNAEPWTDNQIEAAATIYAYLNEAEGAPLQVMADSRPTSKGLAGHRQGIDPWRVAGGEIWSASRGKICPGDAKMAQLPVIVARAAELRHGSPSPTPAPSPATHPDRMPWPFGPGQYVGDVKGPAASHGGYYASERDFIRNVQQWLIYKGCAAGVPASAWGTSSWADGQFQAPYSTGAARTWHARYYPGQPYPEQVWADDYARLATA